MKENPKVVVFYPWPNILERKSGASRRTGHMLDVLKGEYDLEVVSPTGTRDFRDGNVLYTSCRRPFLTSLTLDTVRRLYNGSLYLPTLGRSRGDAGWLWQHCQYAIDPVFSKYVDGVVSRTDVAVVEYAFAASPVIRAFHRRSKKVIVTEHDVIFNQVSGVGFLRSLTRKVEIAALRAADKVVCVSGSDAEVFKAAGVNAEVIPHGIDLSQYVPDAGDGNWGETLSGLGVSDFPKRRLCLFVGASHGPNFEAVRIIRDLARSMQRRTPDEMVNFVVVGDCSQPSRCDNFLSLGRVDDETLRVIYQASDIVLVPLMKGTGASLKVIEAMAHAKLVLGTSIGLRGYPVVSGFNCVISDDLAEYRELIDGFLAREDRRREVGSNARQFAEGYDYRTVYKRYIELIRGCLRR